MTFLGCNISIYTWQITHGRRVRTKVHGGCDAQPLRAGSQNQASDNGNHHKVMLVRALVACEQATHLLWCHKLPMLMNNMLHPG